MLKQGTMGDKVSALTAIVKKNPVHAVTYLHNLLGLAKKKNRKLAELAINSLKELFCESEEALLQDDHKLSPFSKNPIFSTGNHAPTQAQLVQAYFEHQLKEAYAEFITGVLKPLTHDDLEFHRKLGLNVL